MRVGVLATDVSDFAPVTYGDYVRVQAGTASPLTVTPLLNDRDPLQGLLEIESVVPNAAGRIGGVRPPAGCSTSTVSRRVT